MNTWRAGWMAYWVEVSGIVGTRRWVGWVTATLVSTTLYEIVKAGAGWWLATLGW